jgi:hypothetical protein
MIHLHGRASWFVFLWARKAEDFHPLELDRGTRLPAYWHRWEKRRIR